MWKSIPWYVESYYKLWAIYSNERILLARDLDKSVADYIVQLHNSSIVIPENFGQEIMANDAGMRVAYGDKYEATKSW